MWQDSWFCYSHLLHQIIQVHYTFEYLANNFFGSFLKDFISFQRGGQRGRKRGRETSMCGWLSCTPYWGPGPQPQHVPWLGLKLVTFWFAGQRSIHWATPARVEFLIRRSYYLFFLIFIKLLGLHWLIGSYYPFSLFITFILYFCAWMYTGYAIQSKFEQ